jgi:hypothetical protein
MLALLIIEAAAIALLGLLVVGLLRSHAEILRRLHEMGEGLDEPRPRTRQPNAATGGPAANLAGLTLDGEAVEIALAGRSQDTLLAFLSSTCLTCEPFWQSLVAGVQAPGGADVIAVVQAGDSVPRLRRLAGDELLVIASDGAWTDYDVPGSPHFVYVDGPSGRVVGEGTANSWPQVRDLLEHAGQSAVPDGRDNPDRIDRELAAAGIGPGHPSLYLAGEPSQSSA